MVRRRWLVAAAFSSVVVGPDEQPADVGPALPRLDLEILDDALDLAGQDVVVEVDVDHGGDLVGRGMDRQDVADPDHAGLAQSEVAKAARQSGVGRLTDQQTFRFIAVKINEMYRGYTRFNA